MWDPNIEKFSFCIIMVRTNNGSEFQAKFHWHVEDLGMQHAYIKPASPNLNGKVERSHLIGKQVFYQFIAYKGDVDLGKKRLVDWEAFYNFSRPHSALKGQTPYEILKEKMTA